jgi:hypothetical protein
VATYRVGPAGATVFDEHGAVVVSLPPGVVVVAGSLDCAGSLASRHADNERERKRLAGYADKRISPTEDKRV